MNRYPSEPSNPKGKSEGQAIRWYNRAAMGLKILLEASESGSGAAAEKLHRISDDLVEAAGRYGMASNV